MKDEEKLSCWIRQGMLYGKRGKLSEMKSRGNPKLVEIIKVKVKEGKGESEEWEDNHQGELKLRFLPKSIWA